MDPPGTNEGGRAFQGYYGNSSATEKKIVRDVLTKGDYYFRTGDLVRCTLDGWRKYTKFEDRLGDTFRWKGENVSTMVIALLQYLTGRKSRRSWVHSLELMMSMFMGSFFLIMTGGQVVLHSLLNTAIWTLEHWRNI
jgi:hypothetical protein